jgi:hypothetical protein
MGTEMLRCAQHDRAVLSSHTLVGVPLWALSEWWLTMSLKFAPMGLAPALATVTMIGTFVTLLS